MDYVQKNNWDIQDVGVLNNLKLKVVDEFWKLFCKIRKGYRVDLEFILEEISYINLHNKDLWIDDSVLQYYLNNTWTQS